jgi:hypothetical protein
MLKNISQQIRARNLKEEIYGTFKTITDARNIFCVPTERKWKISKKINARCVVSAKCEPLS